MAEQVLLCCFGFPPIAGIGGRRWAKFAKGLALSGVEVHVIRAGMPTTGNSPWTSDVRHARIHVHEVASRYPTAITNNAGGLLGRIQYRLAMRQLRKRESGTIFDVAIGWQSAFRQKALELIDRHNITKVLATGAPFNLLYYAVQLKQDRAHLRVLCDYRDPWITAKNYGMAQLDAARMAAEIDKQELVFRLADVITSPSRFINDEIVASGRTQPQGTVAELPHFFDPDDVQEVGQAPLSPGIRLVYGGALYLGLDPALGQLAVALEHVRKHAPALWDPLTIDIYTPDSPDQPLLKGFGDKLRIHPAIGKDFFKELDASHGALVFLADYNCNFLTTKFYEYQPFAKPMLYFGPAGFVADTLEQKGLGSWIQTPHDFESALQRLQSGVSVPALESATLQQRTQELLDLLV